MYSLIIDTETVNYKKPLVWEIGGAVIDNNCNIIHTFSFAVKEITNHKIFSKAIEKKINFIDYLELIDNTYSFLEIKKYIDILIDKYNIIDIYAYNISYDIRVLNNTMQYIMNTPYFFSPEDFSFLDILKMARVTFSHCLNYQNFCKKNNFITKNNHVKITAEVVYRYIVNNISFKEEHRGLSDVLIEIEIYKYIKNYNGLLF